MAAPGPDGPPLEEHGQHLFEILAAFIMRIADAMEILLQRAAPLLLRVGQAADQLMKLPPVAGYEPFLIGEGRHPIEARFLACATVKIGLELWQERLAERSLASAIGPLAKARDASSLVISRRAKILGRALNEPLVEAPLGNACALASLPESIDSLRELIGRAMDRDDAACRRLTEISKALRPHLRDPRGRIASVASTTHELLLHWHKGVYTYDPIDDDMTDGATLATRAAMNAPKFDPRPARRRQKARRRR